MADKNRLAAECFRRATEAMSKSNWDYAVEMLDQCIIFVPENLMYRQTKRGCSQKKYKDNKTGARMASMKLMKIRARIKKARVKKDWAALDRACEEGLTINPWESSLFFDLGESCREREFDEVAVDAYKMSVINDNKNIPYMKVLAKLLRERGEYSEAMVQWERIHELNPEDPEARGMIAKLLTEKTMDRGGYEDAKDTKDVKTESAAATNAYAQDRAARAGQMSSADAMTEETELSRAVKKEPEEVNHYLKLADFYRQRNENPKAAATLKDALGVSGNDPNIQEILEDVELDMMRDNVQLARQDFLKHKDNEKVKTRYQALKKELVKREVGVLSGRIERYPKDMRLKIELGNRYKSVKQFAKAIPLFQQAVTDVRLQTQALMSLGDCFLQEDKIDLARRQYEKSLENIDRQNQVDEFKHGHYWLGRIYQKQGKLDKADTHYSEILGVDYEYKDVLKRLEKLQAAADEE